MRTGATPALRLRHPAAWFLAALLLTGTSYARTLVTEEEALRTAFPKATFEKETVPLPSTRLARARDLAGPGTTILDAPVTRWKVLLDDEELAVAYVRTRRIRTLAARVLYVVTSTGTPRVSRVEILSWDEPVEYLPRKGWTSQLARPLDDELSIKGAIRPITGATLTSRALTAGAREALAIHQALREEER